MRSDGAFAGLERVSVAVRAKDDPRKDYVSREWRPDGIQLDDYETYQSMWFQPLAKGPTQFKWAEWKEVTDEYLKRFAQSVANTDLNATRFPKPTTLHE